MSYDIVIPVGPKDVGRVARVVEMAKKNAIAHRNIYIVTRCVVPPELNSRVIPETTFPFSVANIRKHPTDRDGWYFQQLVKMYAGEYIPGILPQYLVLDSDTFIVRPTIFLDHRGRLLFDYGTEHHAPYFVHMKRLHPSLRKVHADKSGICHHMMFDKKLVREMMDMVEQHHQNKLPFYRLFIDLVPEENYTGSGASEYEMFFNYMCIHHPEKMMLRPKRISQNAQVGMNYEDTDVHLISYHWYIFDPPFDPQSPVTVPPRDYASCQAPAVVCALFVLFVLWFRE